MTTPLLDPSLFVWVGSTCSSNVGLLEEAGLLRCRNPEGLSEMTRVLSLPDIPPDKKAFPAGSVFIPGTQLWLKADYKRAKIGLVVPSVQTIGDETIVCAAVHKDIVARLDGYSILASTSGLYLCDYSSYYSGKKTNQEHVQKALEG